MGGSISIKISVKYLRVNMWRRAGGVAGGVGKKSGKIT